MRQAEPLQRQQGMGSLAGGDRASGPMGNAPNYRSEESRFDSWLPQACPLGDGVTQQVKSLYLQPADCRFDPRP